MTSYKPCYFFNLPHNKKTDRITPILSVFTLIIVLFFGPEQLLLNYKPLVRIISVLLKSQLSSSKIWSPIDLALITPEPGLRIDSI